MSSKYPDYSCEYAKSGRSECKICHSCIGQDTVRVARYVQSPFFDGKMPQWHHLRCFFNKYMPSDPSEIQGFDNLRWDDQQRIKEKMGLITVSSEVLDKVVVNQPVSTDQSAQPQSVSVEYSKSNRSKCKKCEKKIERDELRFGIKGSKSSLDGFYHLDCFTATHKEKEFAIGIDELKGIDELENKDQELIKEAIGKTASKRKLSDENKPARGKKVKIENNENFDPSKLDNLEREKLLKTQSDLIWSLKDKLDKELSTDDMRQLIEHNNQTLKVKGRADLLSFLTDIMIFGPLKPCTECGGQLIVSGDAYTCTGNISSWTSCVYRSQQPNRLAKFDIPADLKNYECLKAFKFQPRTRMFAKTLDQTANKTSEAKASFDQTTRKSCYKLYFAYCGKGMSRSNQQMRMLIEKHGGKFGADINTHTVAVISSRVEVEKMNKKMRECQTLELHVVSEEFLDELEEPDIHTRVNRSNIDELIMKHCICDWGSDLKQRIAECEKSFDQQSKLSETTNKDETKSGEGKLKLKLKGGAVVDPESNLEDEGHVLLERSTNQPYTAVLNMVDLARDMNSYYKLQIIELDNHKKWHVFRSWGRIGTNIGGNKLENYYSKDSAIVAFENLYLEKTGNEWSERAHASKKPLKFYPLELDYGSNQDNMSVSNRLNEKGFVSKSKLAKPIQNIIQMIFDIEKLKQQMKEFEIDLNKMPLGKISKNQINQAFGILNELNRLIESKASDTKFLDACNRFYSLIPHDFGLKSPPLLKEADRIKEKIEMLNSLLEIEIAFNILNVDGDQSDDPIDIHYKKLHCEMEVLEKESEEFKLIVRYLHNTHAKTHDNYKLVVKDVLKVSREGECDKYKKNSHLTNKKLLWHGSRVTNFAGILSQGLRIAPPEAPSTGYMFGKGVYFADMVSKSANYCFASSSSPSALILLCEVALGNQYERTSAEYVTKLPRDKHSTKGIGRTMPDPKESHVTDDGVEIPMGRGIDSGVPNTSLLYNEYIVYDTSQVQMKYLINVEFQFNY